MTDIARPRHAAQGRASRIAGRTALGLIGGSAAMLAVAGPAGAAALDLDGAGSTDDGSLDLQLAADGLAAPGLADLGLPGLPTELPTDGLPVDGLDFEGVALDLFDVAGALPGLPSLPAVSDLPSLPAAEDVVSSLPVELPALPAVEDLSLPTVEDLSLPAVEDVTSAVELPALPAVGDLAAPELPDLPAVPDVAGTVTGLAGGLPTAAQLDLDEVSTDALPSVDVFSATDLVQDLI